MAKEGVSRLYGPGLQLGYELALPAIAVVLLAFALYIGIRNRRWPSVCVEWFILSLVGARLLQVLGLALFPATYWRLETLLAFAPFSHFLAYGGPYGELNWVSYLWTPLTYAFLHADGVHLFTNGITVFIFGRPLAWRLGPKGFFLLFAMSSVSGALFHLVLEFWTLSPMIGASAGAAGLMGASLRFVPNAKDRLKALFWPDQTIQTAQFMDTRTLLTERRGWSYVALCFLIFPLGLTAYALGAAGNVAVMSHLGGFLFGYFGFKALDRRRPSHQPVDALPKVTPRKAESSSMKLLRFLAVVMLLIGALMGGLGYYFELLVP